MIMKKIRNYLILLTILVVSLFLLTGCREKSLADNLDNEVKENAQYLLETVPNPVVDSVGGEWAVKCIADSGIEVDNEYFDKYFNNLCAVLKANKGILSEDKLTEYTRVTIALNSIGKVSTDIEGYNLVTPLDNYKVVTRQGVNAAAFALVASNISGVKLENEE